MATSDGLRAELANGFFATITEAHKRGINGQDIQDYVGEQSAAYSIEGTQQDIDRALMDDYPIVSHAIAESGFPALEEQEQAQLVAAEDLPVFVKAEKDAAQAVIEADWLLQRLDRFMSIAKEINSIAIPEVQGEE